MNILKLILRNLSYYRKKNLALALGISISAAILTGALIVGDSVKYSLNRIVAQRLGEVTHTVTSGDRYFTSELAEKMSRQLNTPVSSILLTDGSVIAEGGQKRIPNVQIVGVDRNFDALAGISNYYSKLNADEVILSLNLANRLGLSQGEEVLVRMTKASLIPLNAPFVSDDDNIVSVRMKIIEIADNSKLGTFNLKNSQTAPFNAFVSGDFLNDLMEFENKSNLLLLANESLHGTGKIEESLNEQWTLMDAGLILKSLPEKNEIDVSSERVFIDNTTAASLKNLPQLKFPILSYFVERRNTRRRGAGLDREQVSECRKRRPDQSTKEPCCCG